MEAATALSRTDVQTALSRVCDSWNAGDPNSLAESYADDGRLIDPLGVSSRGRDAIAARFGEILGGPAAGSAALYYSHFSGARR